MSKKLSTLFALVLMLGLAGAAMADTPADQDLAAILALDVEACETVAPTAEPAAELDLENALQIELSDTEPCNQRVCGHNQFCCNFSCSICAPDGGFCTQQLCE